MESPWRVSLPHILNIKKEVNSLNPNNNSKMGYYWRRKRLKTRPMRRQRAKVAMGDKNGTGYFE